MTIQQTCKHKKNTYVGNEENGFLLNSFSNSKSCIRVHFIQVNYRVD